MTSPHPSQRQRVSPTQLLDIRERKWRPQLESVSLASEAEVAQPHLEQAAKALGMLFTTALDRKRDPLLTRWPACTVAATVGVATAHYSSGAFWPSLWKVAGVPSPRQDTETWGRSVIASLELLRLDTFPERHLPYVGPILMHSGIPTYCLTDVFALLLERATVFPGIDAPSFHHWAVSGQHRLNSLDVPARRFIAAGGDYSLEVIERCMTLLDRLRDDPDSACREVGLPPRFHQPALTALEQASARGTLPTHGSGDRALHRPTRPRLRLDPYVHGVHLELPILGDTDDDIAQWQISTDHGTHLVRGRDRWVGGAGTAEPVRFPISPPTRTVRAGPRGTNVEERLTLVNPNDPVLVFTDDDGLVDPRFSLPPGPTWLLHPTERELQFAEETATLDTAEAPYGWEGWTLIRVWLHRGGWIALKDGPHHHVQGRARPHVEQEAAVSGVSTPHGSPVHADLPVVVLPEAEGALVDWRVEVLPAAGGRPLATFDASSAERVAPLTGLPRPVVGQFVINVRGPLGRGIRRHVTVAEGMHVSHSPRLRVLTPRGLDPGTTQLSGPSGLDVQPTRLYLGEEETSHTAQLHAGTTTLTVVVTPPHFALLSTGSTGAQWRPQALDLDAESVAEAGDLIVRVPAGQPDAAAELTSLTVLNGDEVVQQVRPSARPGDPTVRYPLAQTSETAASHPRLRMVVGYRGRVMPVALVTPRRLAESAYQENGVLVLDGFCGIEGVSAALYAHHAPWRPPQIMGIPPTGRVALPEELHACGPLRVLLAVDDPWSLAEWPRWPQPHSPNLLTCDASGYLSIGDPQESLLSRALAGDGDLSEMRPTRANAIRMWRVLELSRNLMEVGVAENGIELCADTLGQFPVTALLAHGESGLSPDVSTRSLILSGLVGAQHDGITSAEAAELWQRLPAAAALATSDLLPRIPLDPGRQTPEHIELLEEAEQQCGANALRLLDGDIDPAAGVGGFDDTTEHLDRMPAEQVEAVWRAAQVVPQALLDSDSRSSAALGLFTARRQPELGRARRGTETITETALAMCDRLPDMYRDTTHTLIQSRRSPRAGGGWRHLPAVSIALAVTARLAARGVTACQTLERAWRPMWAELASVAPAIATLDIVLAELTLAGIERTHLFARE